MGTITKVTSRTFKKFLRGRKGNLVPVECKGTVRASGLLLWSHFSSPFGRSWCRYGHHHGLGRQVEQALAGIDPGVYDNSVFIVMSPRLAGAVLYGDPFPAGRAVFDGKGRKVRFRRVAPLSFKRWRHRTSWSDEDSG